MAFNWLNEPLKYLLSSQVITQTGNSLDGLAFDTIIYLVTLVFIVVGIILGTFVLKNKDIQINLVEHMNSIQE